MAEAPAGEKNRLPLIAALLLGAAAALGVLLYMQGIKRKIERETRRVPVLVAKEDIDPGTPLSRKFVEEVPIPANLFNPQYIRGRELKEILDQPIGRRVEKGEPVLWAYFGEEAVQEKLSRFIQKGERAITLAATPVSGIEGMIEPNDHVDVLGTFAVPKTVVQKVQTPQGSVPVSSTTTEEATVILLQNVPVLACGSRHSGSPRPAEGATEPYASITVSVSPEEASLLAFAQDHGRLTFTLRNPADLSDTEEIRIINYKYILDLVNLSSIAKNHRIRVIKIHYGGEEATVEIAE